MSSYFLKNLQTFKKYEDTFALYRLPSSYGCIIYNSKYFIDEDVSLPEESDVLRLLAQIKEASRKGIVARSETDRINMMIAWNSKKVVKANEYEAADESNKERVAPVNTYTRAYFSHGRNCKYSRNCIYDCQGRFIGARNRRKVRKGRVYPFSREGTKNFLVFPVEEFKNRVPLSVISNTRQNANAVVYTRYKGKGVRNWVNENPMRKKK